MTLRYIVQTNGAIRLLSTVLAPGKELVDLTLQASAFLFLFLLCLVGEDEHPSVGSELVLQGSSPVSLEHGCQAVLDLVHKAHSLEGHPHTHAVHKPSRHWWVKDLFIPHLLLWGQSLSSLLVVWNLLLILWSILSLPALSLATSISGSFLLVIVMILLPLPVIGTAIIIPIGIQTPKVRSLIVKNLIIIAIEPETQPIPIIHKAIVVAIDLQIDVAVLYAKGIMVAIDGKSKRAVSDVDQVVVARDGYGALSILDGLLGTVVKDVHYLQCLYPLLSVNYFQGQVQKGEFLPLPLLV